MGLHMWGRSSAIPPRDHAAASNIAGHRSFPDENREILAYGGAASER
jgi:hypothetical protein